MIIADYEEVVNILSKKNILFLSHTNRLPQRTINLINHFKINNNIFLINWKRDLNQKNNFHDINHINISASPTLFGLLKFYFAVLIVSWELATDCGFCNNIKCLPVLKLVCKLKRCPIIYDHFEYPSLEVAIKIQRYLNLKTIKRIRIFSEFVENQLFKLADGIIIVDSKNSRLLKRVRKCHSNSCCVMNYPSGKLTAAWDKKNQFKKKYGDRKIVIFCGSIFRATGLYKYLDLIARIKKEEPEIILLLIGVFRNENIDEVMKYIRELKIEEHVEILPWMMYETLLGLLEIAILGLAIYDPNHLKFTELSVGNSRKIFTYMQAGLPSVVSLEPIGKFVEKYRVGKMVNFNDDQEIYNTVRFLMDNDNIRRSMRIRGKNLIRNKFNLENELKKIDEVYEKSFI